MSALSKAEDKIENAKAAMRRMKAEAEVQGVAVAGTVTQIVAGGLLGAMEEYWGTGAVMGVDIPMVIGVPTAAMALFGVGGEPTDFANALLRQTGNACLTIEAYKKGGQLAAEWGERRLAG